MSFLATWPSLILMGPTPNFLSYSSLGLSPPQDFYLSLLDRIPVLFFAPSSLLFFFLVLVQASSLVVIHSLQLRPSPTTAHFLLFSSRISLLTPGGPRCLRDKRKCGMCFLLIFIIPPSFPFPPPVFRFLIINVTTVQTKVFKP